MLEPKTPYGGPWSYTRSSFITLALLASALCPGCGDDEGGQESAGDACEAANHCYADVEPDDLVGEALCLDRVSGGYCTHTCQTDADCCAAEGECPDDRPQVCAPFESTGMMMCFLSCEAEDIDENADDYCRAHSHDEFTCRSTGGGSNNRKVCS